MWGQNNLKFKSRPVSYLRGMSEDEMTDSIKGSKDSVTKYSQGTEGVTVTELPSSSLYSQQTSRGA